MAYQQEYYLEDFDDHANERIPNEYNALKTCPAWTMEFKTIRDGDNILKRVPMLLVGRYHTSHGRQDAWAWATGHTIHYFHAHRGDEFVGTIDNLQKNRVYYREPLTWAVGHQDTIHGMTKSRHTTKALAELLINFMFLLEDKILSVPSSGNSSLLSDFEYACRMFVMRRDEARNPRDEYFPYYGDAYRQAGARGPGSWRSGGSDTSSTFSTIKNEPRDGNAPSSRISGSPYRSSYSSTPKKAMGTTSSIKSRRHDPYMGIQKEPGDDEGSASVSWSGSSYTSTPFRTSKPPYLGMFEPNASTIRSGSGTSGNPSQPPLDRARVEPRVNTHNRPSSSFTSSLFSQPRRDSSIYTPPARPNEQAPDTPTKIKTDPDQDRPAVEHPARVYSRKQSTVPAHPAHGLRGTNASEQAVADRIRALTKGIKRCRENEEPGYAEERSAQRTKVKQEAEEAGYEEIW